MLRILGTAGRRAASRAPMLGVRSLSTSEYHDIADNTLEAITQGYETLIETRPEIDVDLSHGVLTLVLPPSGTYVINKQPPNKQIWLSSPVSGPKRYDWDEQAQKWVYSRDNSSLGELLRTETRDATNAELAMNEVD